MGEPNPRCRRANLLSTSSRALKVSFEDFSLRHFHELVSLSLSLGTICLSSPLANEVYLIPRSSFNWIFWSVRSELEAFCPPVLSLAPLAPGTCIWWSSLPSCVEMHCPRRPPPPTLGTCHSWEGRGWPWAWFPDEHTMPPPTSTGSTWRAGSLWAPPAESIQPFLTTSLSLSLPSLCLPLCEEWWGFETSPGRPLSPLGHSHPRLAGHTLLKDHRN